MTNNIKEYKTLLSTVYKMNQEFEIIKDEDLYEAEKEARSKIKYYNEKGYTCTSQSIMKTTYYWVISLLFNPTRAAFGV